MSYSCKHWFKRLSKSKLCMGGGGDLEVKAVITFKI